MRISIFGLGYVGVVTSACLARDGHDIMGVDVNPAKVDVLAAGRSPIVEPGLDALISRAAASGRLRATTDCVAAVAASDVSLVSVGTPSQSDGSPDLQHVFRVCEEIGAAVAAKGGAHTVILRSTVPPGTTGECASILEVAARGISVSVAFNPEFLREGSAIRDYDTPPYTVIGTSDASAAEVARGMYSAVAAPLLIVRPAVAELLKYVSNAWHATKIVFANEIGRVAKDSGVDGREVMSLMSQDAKLNISTAYLRPGFAYGGSCLPKDVRALVAQARTHNLPVPLLDSLQISNEHQIEAAVRTILSRRPLRVAVLGLAFKSSTDDLRESPAVTLVKRLLGEGCEVRIYAPDVNRARLMGTNLSYIRENLPHFEALLIDSADGVVEWSDVVVATQADDDLQKVLADATGPRFIVDLTGLAPEAIDHAGYDGIAW